MTQGPIRLAVVNDYDVVVQGFARMLEPFADRVVVVDVATNNPVHERVDIAVVDTFAQSRGFEQVLTGLNAAKIVIYSWSLEPAQTTAWSRLGAVGFLDKRLTAEELVEALEQIHTGEAVVNETQEPEHEYAGDWPGQLLGLTPRESEVIALIAQGRSNQDIAERAFMSINTVKSYIRSAYGKMGVTSRSQAILWWLDHGFHPDHLRAQAPDDAR